MLNLFCKVFVPRGICFFLIFLSDYTWPVVILDFLPHLVVFHVSVFIQFCLRLSRWPRTLAGITAYLQCTRNIHGSGIYPGNPQDERKAWRRCDRGGFWADDDYSRCQYANDVTRVLYMFNQVTRESSRWLRWLIYFRWNARCVFVCVLNTSKAQGFGVSIQLLCLGD